MTLLDRPDALTALGIVSAAGVQLSNGVRSAAQRSGKARRAQRGNSRARRAKTSAAQAWFTRGTIKAHEVAFDFWHSKLNHRNNDPDNREMCRIKNIEKQFRATNIWPKKLSNK